MRVVIKGTESDAVKAAAEHGIPFTFITKLNIGSVLGYTDASEEVLNKWLCEAPDQPPYPPGALLWWAPGRSAHEIHSETAEG